MAWSVARLAEDWECSRTTIYQMISAGKLRAFPVGAGMKGIRISDEEKARWEKEGDAPKDTGTETSRSGDEKTERPLPASQMKALASAGG